MYVYGTGMPKIKERASYLWQLTGLISMIASAHLDLKNFDPGSICYCNVFFSSLLRLSLGILVGRGFDKRSTAPEERQFWKSTYSGVPLAQAQMSEIGDTSSLTCTWKIYSVVRRR